MLGKDYEHQACSIAGALEVIGERWTLLIVRDALYGVRRFSEFQAHLDIPKAVLAVRLKSLVDDGVLVRKPDPDHAGRSLYELTAAGRELWPVLYALLVWGDRHRRPNSRTFVHGSCQTQLDETGSCPSCGITPRLQEIVTIPRRRQDKSRDDPVARALRHPHPLLEPIET